MSETKFSIKCRELIVNGRCRADCCGPVPMKEGFFKKHEDKAGDFCRKITFFGDVALYVVGRKCCFLDMSHKCRIYETRPKVCQQFGDESHILLSCPHITHDGLARDPVDMAKRFKELIAARDNISHTLRGFS